MNTVSTLPEFGDAELQSLSPAGLLNLLTQNEDRVPRQVIDECARHGGDMVEALACVAGKDDLRRQRVTQGEWWLQMHAILILGLIPSERAGRLLVDCMRRMSESGDDDLQDWCAGYWPALFRNKPATVIPALRSLSLDRDLDWYMRANAMEPVVAAAEEQGNAALEETLAWLAGICTDESENWEFRLSCAQVLMDFPRAAHRPLLEALAEMQGTGDCGFSMDDVATAYEAGKDEPQWLRFADPWKFYSPDAIASRQARWAEEDAEYLQQLDEETILARHFETPFMRPTSKTGRNDPCPCGSGKKYKKCCLENESA